MLPLVDVNKANLPMATLLVASVIFAPAVSPIQVLPVPDVRSFKASLPIPTFSLPVTVPTPVLGPIRTFFFPSG